MFEGWKDLRSEPGITWLAHDKFDIFLGGGWMLRYEEFHDFGTVLRVYALHLLDVFLLYNSKRPPSLPHKHEQ